MLNFERRSGRLQSRTRRESPAYGCVAAKPSSKITLKISFESSFALKPPSQSCCETCISPTSFESIYFLSTVGKMMSIRAISRAIPRSVFRSRAPALRPLSSISRPSLLQKFYKPAPVQQTYPAFSTSFTRREPAGDCGIYQFPI